MIKVPNDERSATQRKFNSSTAAGHQKIITNSKITRLLIFVKTCLSLSLEKIFNQNFAFPHLKFYAFYEKN